MKIAWTGCWLAAIVAVATASAQAQIPGRTVPGQLTGFQDPVEHSHAAPGAMAPGAVVYGDWQGGAPSGGCPVCGHGGAVATGMEDIMQPGSAHVTVTIPEEAKLFVNDNPTAYKGTTRFFVVRCLEAGKQYRFRFRAEMETPAGVKVEFHRLVVLEAGKSENILIPGPNDVCDNDPNAVWKKKEEKKEEGAAGG